MKDRKLKCGAIALLLLAVLLCGCRGREITGSALDGEIRATLTFTVGETAYRVRAELSEPDGEGDRDGTLTVLAPEGSAGLRYRKTGQTYSVERGENEEQIPDCVLFDFLPLLHPTGTRSESGRDRVTYRDGAIIYDLRYDDPRGDLPTSVTRSDGSSGKTETVTIEPVPDGGTP